MTVALSPNADVAGLASDCSLRRLAFDRLPTGWGPMPTVIVDFHAGSFSPDLFGSQGVACPEVIAHSARKRQAEFFYGRWAARLALASLGVAPAEIAIGPGREPVWPAGLSGSISHADDIAVACACRPEAGGAVGIDLERVPPARVLAQIAHLTSNAAEKACLDRWASAHPELRPGLLPTLLFSVKESIYKALCPALGSGLDFKDVVLTELDLPRREIQVVSSRRLAPDWPRGQSRTALFELLDEAVILTCFAWQR